ncbi:conserved hypothetical protein [Ricinus communis]|uniref:Wall-associated receptor kinase C-terminal domain-containing protein n=1 Tax=Ricinus communis TaxID=3988 RepID=B9RZQ5_RICCO|nr:conserved hypothetical protein [Ricinus communis]
MPNIVLIKGHMCSRKEQFQINEDLVQASQEGFRLTWKQPIDGKCQSCEANGGFSGYKNGSPNNFFCICSNGRPSTNCHDNGGSSTEKGNFFF